MMPNWVTTLYHRWLDKRLPALDSIRLNQSRLFVLPSRQGLYFLAVLLLLIIAAINYQNNLAYALAFFLFSLFVSVIFLTFFNLHGLVIEVGKNLPVFAGDLAKVQVHLKKNTTRYYQRLQINFASHPPVYCDLVLEDESSIEIPLQTERRGILMPERYTISTQYPMGMVTCWSHLAMPKPILVYPRPQFLARWPATRVKGGTGKALTSSVGQDDFHGFRTYRPGDPQRLINWRSLAKGQSLNSKSFHSHEDDDLWVDWYALSDRDTETRLSLLCGWIMTLNKQGSTYGLRLHKLEIAPDSGERHYHRTLTALALFNRRVDA